MMYLIFTDENINTWDFLTLSDVVTFSTASKFTAGSYVFPSTIQFMRTYVLTFLILPSSSLPSLSLSGLTISNAVMNKLIAGKDLSVGK